MDALSVPNKNVSSAATITTSTAQKEFPELAMTGKRALPECFSQDQFKFPLGTVSGLDANRLERSIVDIGLGLTTSQRVLNWLDIDNMPLVISGCKGIGKSVLAWQIMNEAHAKGIVPIMVTAPEFVLHQELPFEQKNGLPYSQIKTLDDVIQKLKSLQGNGHVDGRSILLIIDGITPVSYNPDNHLGCQPSLRAIRSLGAKVILNIDSDQQLLKGNTIDEYQRFLNPDQYASQGLILTRDINLDKTLVRKDIIHKR
jgi:hypothetical protein